jgi:hypothetical protein
MTTRTGRFRRRVMPLVLLAGLRAAATQAGVPPPLPERPGMVNPRNAGRPVGHWAGMLPDAECGAVRTELRLVTGLDGPDGGYLMSERCVNDPPGLASRVSRGRWQTLRGSPVFQLLDASPDGARSFALQPDGDLHELDAALRDPGPSRRWRVLSRVP